MKTQAKKKIANSKMTDRTTRLPVELDVPFAASIVGFRPTRLPPLPEGLSGVSIGHIQARNWADRVGLSIGDVITHVNGISVAGMTMPDEFTEPMKTRPLHLSVELAVPPNEISRVLAEFNWSSRLHEVGQVRSVSGANTNEMFERVFAKTASPDSPSGLFDVSNWIGLPAANATDPLNDSSSSGSSRQISIHSTPVTSPPPEPSFPADPQPMLAAQPILVPQPAKPRSRKFKPDSTKWIPKSPLTVSLMIHQGIALPESAGALDLDSFFQPFSSDPFMEVFLALAPPSDTQMTLASINECRHIETLARTQSGICNNGQIWNHAATLSVSNTRLRVNDLIIVGKLWDYRRLSAQKLMGVFAIPLDAVEIASDDTLIKPQIVSLTSADPLCFDVSKSKIKISVFTFGNSKLIPGSPATLSSGNTSHKSSPVVGAATPADGSGQASPILHDIPVVYEPEVYIPTPFERALAQARADIRNGDFSPLRQQAYTLR